MDADIKIVKQDDWRKQLTDAAETFEHFERRCDAISLRVSRLETRKRSALSDEPEERMILLFVGIYLLLQFLPLLAEMIAAWRKRS